MSFQLQSLIGLLAISLLAWALSERRGPAPEAQGLYEEIVEDG